MYESNTPSNLAFAGPAFTPWKTSPVEREKKKHHIVYIHYDENPDGTIKYKHDCSKRNTAHCLPAIAPIPDLALSQIPKMICQTHITCRTLVRRRYDALEPI